VSTEETQLTREEKLAKLKGLKRGEYSKAWNKLFPERAKEAYQRWAEKHPEKVKAHLEALRKRPDIIEKKKARSRNSGPDKLRYYRGAFSAVRRCLPWDEVDDCLVMERKMTDRALAEKIGRSIRAIQVRRCALNKMAALQEPGHPDNPFLS